ncbi:hypothetical protein JWG41_01465 [Leptospira sp. 201903075]|uniref:hypothetical protein n=1 Tax=Leptospira chreensis TaxID=2810035 RepID=UPI001962AF73|nr:hypothetical protein [Leptospira chreensis]MBM9589097.1 hypothetical protein [Leptospira chreensis]
MYRNIFLVFLFFLAFVEANEAQISNSKDPSLSEIRLPDVPPLDFQTLESMDVPKGKEGNWDWKNDTHIVRLAKGSHALWESFYSIQFPDGSSLTKHKIPKTNINQYTYKKRNRGSFLYYDIVHPNYWGEGKVSIGVFDITYSPKWSLVVDSLRETNRMKDFLEYSKEQFGFRAERIKVVLHESKEKFWIYAGKDPRTKDDCTGFSNGSFFTLCPLPGIILEATGKQSLDAFAKQNYDLRAWKHDTLHYIQSQRCGQLGLDSGGLAEPWFLEGIAELSVIQTDSEHKANTYERFFQKFLHKRTTLKDGNDPKLPDYRLVGTMFLEYLSNLYGNQKISKFYEETCFGKPVETSFVTEFDISIEKATADMYDYFQKNRSNFENQFLVWRLNEKPKLSKKTREIPEHCNKTSVPVPKNPNEILEFQHIPCIMRNQVYDFVDLQGLYEGEFSGISNNSQMESIFLWKSGAYKIQSEGKSWTIGEDEEQWEKDGVRIVNWQKSGDRQIIFPNKKRVHCFYQSKTCSKPYE